MLIASKLLYVFQGKKKRIRKRKRRRRLGGEKLRLRHGLSIYNQASLEL